MQPWVCFSSSSGETFRALCTQLKPEAKAALLGFFVDRECAAETVAREILPAEQVHRFEKKTFEKLALEKLKSLSKAKQSEVCVFLCGYFGILSPEFLNECPGPILNTHPSLLPSFPGLDQKVHKKVYETVPVGGFSLHLVTEELDGGPILFQHPVLLDAGKGWEENRAQVRSAEQKFLPVMLEAILESSLTAQDRKRSSIDIRRQMKTRVVSFQDQQLASVLAHQRSPHVI
jgi:folate-dependent phosphoribosylglycinamide formyltransferase PurN